MYYLKLKLNGKVSKTPAFPTKKELLEIWMPKLVRFTGTYEIVNQPDKVEISEGLLNCQPGIFTNDKFKGEK